MLSVQPAANDTADASQSGRYGVKTRRPAAPPTIMGIPATCNQGNVLKFTDDLGINVIGETRLRVGYRFTADQAIELSISHLFAWGSKVIPTDIHYNGSTVQAGHLDARPRWLVFELNWEPTLFRWGEQDRGAFNLDLGIRYDRPHWEFENFHFSPTSSGHEAAEDFDTQAMPIPMLGASIRQPIASRLDLTAFGRAFRANHWNTFRQEGGTVYWTETAVEAGAGMALRVGASLELSIGYRFLMLDIAEQSGEDGNFVTLRTHGIEVGLTVLF